MICVVNKGTLIISFSSLRFALSMLLAVFLQPNINGLKDMSQDIKIKKGLSINLLGGAEHTFHKEGEQSKVGKANYCDDKWLVNANDVR